MMADLTTLWRFNRPKLASAVAERVVSRERLALFGPRQTGKTTRLREEVIPPLEDRGTVAVYLECWADKTDRLGSINYAMQKALDTLKVSPKGHKCEHAVVDWHQAALLPDWAAPGVGEQAEPGLHVEAVVR